MYFLDGSPLPHLSPASTPWSVVDGPLSDVAGPGRLRFSPRRLWPFVAGIPQAVACNLRSPTPGVWPTAGTEPTGTWETPLDPSEEGRRWSSTKRKYLKRHIRDEVSTRNRKPTSLHFYWQLSVLIETPTRIHWIGFRHKCWDVLLNN